MIIFRKELHFDSSEENKSDDIALLVTKFNASLKMELLISLIA